MDDKNNIFDLDEKALDMMMKYIPEYKEENEKNIKNKFEIKSKKIKRKFLNKRRILSGIAASMIFATGLAYAGIIDISGVYRLIFGEDSNYLEPYIKPLVNTGASNSFAKQSEYDGIVMELISALNDEDSLRIFGTITDTSGDRLGPSLDFTRWGLSQGHGGNISIVDYNNTTKTATFMLTSLGGKHEGEASLKIEGFSTGREFFEDLVENKINIYEIIGDHRPQIISQDLVWKSGGGGFDNKLYEESRLLKADEMDIKFDNTNKFSISNLGFVDGLFHIQIKTMLDETSLLDGYYISAKLLYPDGEIAYDTTTAINFKNDKKYAYQDYSKIPHEAYTELVYGHIKDGDQLKGLSLAIDYMKSPIINEAEWEFSFMIPEKITTDFIIDRKVHINGSELQLTKLSLSPIGITINFEREAIQNYSHEDRVYLAYTDGRTIELDQSTIHIKEDEASLTFKGSIIEIEKLETIIINGEKIDIGL